MNSEQFLLLDKKEWQWIAFAILSIFGTNQLRPPGAGTDVMPLRSWAPELLGANSSSKNGRIGASSLGTWGADARSCRRGCGRGCARSFGDLVVICHDPPNWPTEPLGLALLALTRGGDLPWGWRILLPRKQKTNQASNNRQADNHTSYHKEQ